MLCLKMYLLFIQTKILLELNYVSLLMGCTINHWPESCL